MFKKSFFILLILFSVILNAQTDVVSMIGVLEHLYDPIGALTDMTKTLCQGGIMIHRVDLRDHGMFPNFHPLTLLTFSDKVHKYMTVGSGRPNRVLVNQYRDFLKEAGISGNIRITRLVGINKEFEPVDWKNLDKQYQLTAIKSINLIRPRLNDKFKSLSDEDLATAGFVLVANQN